MIETRKAWCIHWLRIDDQLRNSGTAFHRRSGGPVRSAHCDHGTCARDYTNAQSDSDGHASTHADAHANAHAACGSNPFAQPDADADSDGGA
jgi:hypothetical protein